MLSRPMFFSTIKPMRKKPNEVDRYGLWTEEKKLLEKDILPKANMALRKLVDKPVKNESRRESCIRHFLFITNKVENRIKTLGGRITFLDELGIKLLNNMKSTQPIKKLRP